MKIDGETTTVEKSDRPAPKKAAKKLAPWEAAPTFAALVADLLPNLIARAAPTAPLPGNPPRPTAPGSIEEALVAFSALAPAAAEPPVTAAAPEVPAPVAAETSAEPAGEAAVPVDELEPADEPAPELPVRLAMAAPAPSPSPVIAAAAPDIMPVPVMDFPAPRVAQVTIPVAVVPPPPLADVAPIDFDEDFLPVRDGHIGRASATITVGEGDERVKLRITADSQDVRVHAVTATPEAALELQRGVGELAASLARHGLNLSNLSADAGGQRRSRAEDPESNDRGEPEAAPETDEPVIAAGVRAVI